MKTLILTRECGLKCPFCYQSENKQKVSMGLTTLKHLLDNKGDSFSLFGGEPFRNKKALLYILENYPDKKFSFTTNIIETDLEILKEFAERGMLVGKVTLSADVIGAGVRYSVEKQCYVDEKIKKIAKILNKAKIPIRINVVINPNEFNSYAKTYKYYSDLLINFNNFKIDININTSEKTNLENTDILFKKELYDIINYDFDKYGELKFGLFFKEEFSFCFGHTAYDCDGSQADCHHMFFENIQYEPKFIKSECRKCDNQYCFQCIFTNFNHCAFYKRLKEFIKKEFY
ncbi:MAG: radical SAM protein [Paraclostridium sp.]